MASAPQSDLDRRFSAFLRHYMRQHNLTFAAMSNKVGVSDATIHRIIAGEQGSSLATVSTVAKKLRVSASDIFGDN